MTLKLLFVVSKNTKLISAVAAGVAGVVFGPVLAPIALGCIGFSSGGVVAGLSHDLLSHGKSADTLYSDNPGSLAAAIHSSIGNVAAGSLFAIAQSVGAGGALPAMGYVITGAVAGVGGYFAGPSSKCGKKQESKTPSRHQ